ncbi:hypothetical protein DMP16_02860 [Sulfolobus sp. B1]|uniref:hypothetical protein n=1 Tax=Sulfolobus sp. B1 TaxID=2200888 RepID=UPI00117FB8D6|nr:hypothetical protein [Sulfolobus sp. B1]TRM97375.1 hypothetical protein DMP16_02860 [Sulfolobus sp. B1]
MKEEYNGSLKIKASRGSIFNVLTDPYIFSGASGHITLYKVFDNKKQSFVPQGDAIDPANKFKAAFLYQDEEGNLYAIDSVLEGPQLIMDEISYRFSSDDGNLKISFSFITKDDILNARCVVEYSSSFFDVFRRKAYTKRAKGYGNMAEHLITKHFFYYLPKLGPNIQYNLTEVMRISGDMNELILKLKDALRLDSVYLLLKGDNFKLVGIVKNGEIRNAILKLGNMKYLNEDALSKLFSLNGRGELIVYRAAEESILEKLENLA